MYSKYSKEIIIYDKILSIPDSVKKKFGKLAVVYWRRKEAWGEGENISPQNFLSSKGYAPLWEGAEKVVGWLNKGEKIGIVSDYDADGITSAAILYSFFKGVKGKASFYFPSRWEGYGVSVKALKTLADKGCRKILVLDSGTSFNEVLRYGRDELGLEIIVVDHHEEKEKTEGGFLINPKAHGIPYLKDLCTAGLAFYLAGAVNEIMG